MTRSPLIALVALSLVFVSTVSAAETTTTGTATPVPEVMTQTTQDTPLLLSTVSVTDAMTVGLEFNQAIQIDSLRVRIIDQATNESVRIASITGSTTTNIATVKTSTALTAGASYVLTITSALSITEMTIKAGIDSIREFSVPVTLKGASLNAPSNPNAVISGSGAAKPTLTQSGSASGSMTKPEDTEALPATGTPTTILIILAAISASALLFVRKRA